MHRQKVHPCLRIPENCGTHISQKESRPAVVAESQKQFRLPLCQRTLFVEFGGGFCPGGIPAGQSRQQGNGTDTPQAKEGPHDGRKDRAQKGIDSHPQKEGRDRKEGKQGRDHRPCAEGQSAPDCQRGFLRTEEKCRGKEKGKQYG